MAAEQVVGLRLDLDADDLKKELAASGKAADQLAGDMQGLGGKIERVMSGIVDSASNVEQGIRGVDQRLETLTGADREVFLRANIGQAEQALRQIDQMLTDPTLTDAEIRIVLENREQVSAQIDALKGEMGELEQAVSDVGEEGERSFGALAGAIGSAALADRLDSAVTSSGKLRAQLGLTADEAREFDAIAKQVYRDNFGESMGDAAQVVGQVHQALRLTGDELLTTTEGVFAIRDAFEHLGADVDTTLNATRTMKANFPGMDEAEVLDLIASGFQNGAGRAGDFIDVLNEYPGDFARIGLSAEDMVGIINEGLDAGVWNADRVGDAVREMGIRITTAGDTGQDAIREMFPADEAERLIRDFGRGGDAGREAFFTILDGLTQVEDPAQRFNLSVELMGTLGEELANQFPSMREGLLQVRDGAQEAGTGVEGLNEQYDGFRNTIEGFLRGLETSALGTLGDVGVGFADIGSNVGIAVLGLKGMMDVVPGLDRGVRSLAGNFGKLAKNGGAIAIAGIAVERTINAWGDAMADAQDDAEGFVETFTKSSVRPVDSLEELHDEIMRVGGAAAEMKRRGDEALNPFLKERFREAEAGLILTRDALLESEAAAAQFQRELGVSADEAARMATNSDLVTAATDQVTGELDSGKAAREQAKLDYEAMSDAVDAYNDSLHALFDPLWGFQDALLANEDAQAAVQAAQMEALVAQRNLDDAIRKHGRNSDEAALASLELAAAQQRVKDANRDAARTALDVTTATNELSAKMRDGSIDIYAAEEQLRKWVEQGLITEEQAWQTAQELRGVGDRARELEGRSIDIPVRANTTEFEQRMADLYAGWGTAPGIRISVGGGGGLTLSAGGRVPGPSGAGDIVPAMLSPDEFVIRADAAQAIGYDALHALNRGEPMPQTYVAPASASPVVVQAPAGRGGNTYRQDISMVVRDPREAVVELQAAHRAQQLAGA